MGELTRGYTDTFFKGQYDPIYLIRRGDILVGMDGQFNAAKWSSDQALLNQRVCKITSKDESLLLERYLIYLLPDKLKEIEDKTPFVTVKHLSVKDIKNIVFPLPPLHIQEQIADTLDKADALRRKDQELLKKYDELAQAVFYDMFGDPLKGDKRWGKKNIGNLCTLVRGSSPRPKGDNRYYGGSIPRLMIEDITRDGMYVTPRVDSLTKLGATMSRPMKKGDLVLTVSGNTGIPAILAVDACIHDGFVGLRNLSDEVKPTYLYYYLQLLSKSTSSRSVGAIFKNLTTDQVKSIEVPVPPVDFQIRFAYIMNSILKQIEVLKDALYASDSYFKSQSKLIFQ